MENLQLEIAKLIGEPVNPQLPVPVELQAIADVFEVEAGEKVWKYSAVDGDVDVILAVEASTGAITVVKRDPVGDTELTFSGLNSKLEYVLVNSILNSTDTDKLSRRKESITRGMDKREIQLILTALMSKTAGYLPGVNPHEVVPASGDDLYDVIMAMKHKVEDYGDGYVLLCGSNVKEAIDLYDKAKASSFNYNVTLTAKLRELGIEVVKVFGKVSSASNESETVILDADAMILVAKNSRISEGKPIKFVRRKIGADIAKLMGADVDKAQRAIIVNPTPVVVAGTNTLAFGIYGYESIIFAITNPYAVCIADASDVL